MAEQSRAQKLYLRSWQSGGQRDLWQPGAPKESLAQSCCYKHKGRAASLGPQTFWKGSVWQPGAPWEPVLLSCSITPTLGNSRIFKLNLGNGPVFMVLQKP